MDLLLICANRPPPPHHCYFIIAHMGRHLSSRIHCLTRVRKKIKHHCSAAQSKAPPPPQKKKTMALGTPACSAPQAVWQSNYHITLGITRMAHPGVSHPSPPQQPKQTRTHTHAHTHTSRKTHAPTHTRPHPDIRPNIDHVEKTTNTFKNTIRHLHANILCMDRRPSKNKPPLYKGAHRPPCLLAHTRAYTLGEAMPQAYSSEAGSL